jgi:hypothetical protein
MRDKVGTSTTAARFTTDKRFSSQQSATSGSCSGLPDVVESNLCSEIDLPTSAAALA